MEETPSVTTVGFFDEQKEGLLKILEDPRSEADASEVRMSEIATMVAGQVVDSRLTGLKATTVTTTMIYVEREEGPEAGEPPVVRAGVSPFSADSSEACASYSGAGAADVLHILTAGPEGE